MSIIEGQKIVSKRKRMLAYCEQHGIAVPRAFHALGTIYPIAVINRSEPSKPSLVPDTFYNASTVLTYLHDRRKDPQHYEVLNFARGFRYVLNADLTYEKGPTFDHRNDVDEIRSFEPPGQAAGN